MRTILDLAFDWLILGLGASVLIGAGFALLADELRKFKAARICFAIAGVWLSGKVVMWGTFTSENFGVRAGVTALACAIIGVGLVEASRLATNREAETRKSESTQASPPPPAGGDKESTSRTPRELLSFYENVTSLQGDSLIAPFKGLWIRVAGKVETVVDAGGGGVQVTFTDPEGVRCACTFERQWREPLSRLIKNDKISSIGKISEGQNGATLYLKDCELIKPSSEKSGRNTSLAPPIAHPPEVLEAVYNEKRESFYPTLSLEHLSETMSNPRYSDDILRFDRVFDKRSIISDETVFLVVGSTIPAELLDLPVAELLRDEIDRRGKEYAFRRGIVINDQTWYHEIKAIGKNPVIAVGGAEQNKLAKELDAWQPPVSSHEGKYEIKPHCVGFFRRNLSGLPQVGLWGHTAGDTRAAAEHYLQTEKGLTEFLRICWRT